MKSNLYVRRNLYIVFRYTRITSMFCSLVILFLWCAAWLEQWRFWERTVPWEYTWSLTALPSVDGKLCAHRWTCCENPNSVVQHQKKPRSSVTEWVRFRKYCKEFLTLALQSPNLVTHTLIMGKGINGENAQLCQVFLGYVTVQTVVGDFLKESRGEFLWLFSWLTWHFQSPP